MDATEKLEKLKELRVTNTETLQNLMREGAQGINLSHIRMEMFIEKMWPWNDGTNDDRLDFELDWETNAGEALSGLLSEVTRAKLTQGLAMVPPPGPNGNGRN